MRQKVRERHHVHPRVAQPVLPDPRHRLHILWRLRIHLVKHPRQRVVPSRLHALRRPMTRVEIHHHLLDRNRPHHIRLCVPRSVIPRPQRHNPHVPNPLGPILHTQLVRDRLQMRQLAQRAVPILGPVPPPDPQLVIAAHPKHVVVCPRQRLERLSKLHDVITHVSSHEQHRFILEGWIPGLTRRSVRPRTSVLLDPLQVLFIVGMDV
mmetsp:Transcript_3590/g.10368  ORF Transcript_3590/g.10368 Transcript_3590/m.10368 type:complete len:208 (-) Transcript_3590:23-646(-)